MYVLAIDIEADCFLSFVCITVTVTVTVTGPSYHAMCCFVFVSCWKLKKMYGAYRLAFWDILEDVNK